MTRKKFNGLPVGTKVFVVEFSKNGLLPKIITCVKSNKYKRLQGYSYGKFRDAFLKKNKAEWRLKVCLRNWRVNKNS